jgi:hypothetical protein
MSKWVRRLLKPRRTWYHTEHHLLRSLWPSNGASLLRPILSIGSDHNRFDTGLVQKPDGFSAATDQASAPRLAPHWQGYERIVCVSPVYQSTVYNQGEFVCLGCVF